MGSILLVAEIQKGAIREASYELVSFARKLGGDVTSVVIGSGIAGEAEGFAKRGGGKVYVADDPALASYNVDGWAKAIRAAADAAGADVILISNTPSGWDVAPRVALKAQWDRVHTRRDGDGLWRGSDGAPAHSNVLSVAADFVF